MTHQQHATPLPDFTPALPGFRAEQFLALTETLLAVRIEQDQARLDAAPFRLVAPEPAPETPLPALPPRWYPRPAESVIEAARASLVPPPRPAVLHGRASELERVLRPLLSGHPVRVQGEPGAGKTALVAVIAAHERTRQRFRRIWYIDQPARLDQTLALALNLPHTLADPDPAARRALLTQQLDNHTLLIVDNLQPDDPLLPDLLRITEHVLVIVETPPEMVDPDEPLPDDPEGTVTLRALDDTAAIESLAFYAGIEDTRRLRSDLLRIALALGLHPFALMLAGKLVSRDGLALADLEAALALDTPSAPVEDDAEPGEHVTLNRALDVSFAALAGDYRDLFEAFGAFPPDGAPFDGLHAAARFSSPLACRRGLVTLADYGFIHADHRDPDRYIMHPVAYARAAAAKPHAPKHPLGKRVRSWALHYAKDHADDPLSLYRAETALLHALAVASGQPALDTALRPYLREYMPGDPGDDAPPELTGARAEAAALTQTGLDLTDQGALIAAGEALDRALDLRETHDSPHAIAETLVALGRLYDVAGRYEQAAESLIRAAELVYQLGAEPSLSVIRRGLARVYRHLGRLHDALGVLDDAPEAHLERASTLRAMGHHADAVVEMDQAPDATPYARAELYLLAGQYAEALAAITGQDDPAAAHLRAQVYHLQGQPEEAVRGYQAALDACPADDPARAKILRGLGAALASSGHYEAARQALESALDIHRAEDPPNPARLGRTLRLLAAVTLVEGDHERAVNTARDALEKLNAPDDIADTYRTLGRALWRMGDHAGALTAFEHEIEAAQSMADRDERRIGIALHHLADAYHATGSLDRATANYRRALTHKRPVKDPYDYLITQLALHRALMDEDRWQAALDVTQEILDDLAHHGSPDLALYGYVQAIRARTQQVMDRPIRAGQSLAEWTRALAQVAGDASASAAPAIRVLVLGLAVRSLLAEQRPALAMEIAPLSLEAAETHYPDALPAWAARLDLGEAFIALDRPAEAFETLEPLLVEAVTAYPDLAAHAHMLTGRACRAMGDPGAAMDHLRAALNHEPDDHLRGLLRETIGDILLETGQPVEAVESWHTALPLIDREAHPDAAARVLTALAHTLGGLNRYAEAISVYEDALVVLRDVEGVSPVHTADVLRSLGQTHEIQGQLVEAAHVYRRALNVLERADAPRQTRDILHLLARVTAALGDQSAVQLYEQTAGLTREWGDGRELGEVLCELADVHRDAGRLLPAIQNYQAALENQPVPIFARDRAKTLRALGRAHAQMTHYDEARAAWVEALDLSRNLPDESPLEIALTHYAIAEAFRSQNHHKNAERSYREALKHHTPNTVTAAATWLALGQTLIAAGRPDDALEPLRHALDAEKSQPQQANARIVQTLHTLAGAHEARGDRESAITRHHEALVYLDRKLQPVAYTDTLHTLARLYREDDNYDQAVVALNEALEIEGTRVPRSEERISATLQAIADTYRAEGDLERAAEYYQKVTVYANMARRASEDLKDTLNELERRRATLQAAQQSLALLDRSDSGGLKDVAFIHALIARSHAGLRQPEDCDRALGDLLDVLAAHCEDLNLDDDQPDLRALAWLGAAHQARQADDIPAAQAACATALDSARNTNLRWAIEQIAESLG